jgi:hypothetical protein
MDNVQLKFKELDLLLLQEKKKIVLEEIKKGNDSIHKLNDLLDRINKSFLELTNATYDSD